MRKLREGFGRPGLLVVLRHMRPEFGGTAEERRIELQDRARVPSATCRNRHRDFGALGHAHLVEHRCGGLSFWRRRLRLSKRFLALRRLARSRHGRDHNLVGLGQHPAGPFRPDVRDIETATGALRCRISMIGERPGVRYRRRGRASKAPPASTVIRAAGQKTIEENLVEAFGRINGFGNAGRGPGRSRCSPCRREGQDLRG